MENLTNLKETVDTVDAKWIRLNTLVSNALVRKSTMIDTRPFEKDDFLNPLNVIKCFETVEIVFRELTNADESSSRSECICSVIQLCGEHSTEGLLWSNEKCVSMSESVLRRALQYYDCSDLNGFLIKEKTREKLNGTHLFISFLSKLSKDEWKYYPATVHCFSWLLHHIQIPNMKHFIGMVLPVSLNILDDYSLENKLTGINCLYHIIRNISTTELGWHIDIMLLQKILKPLLYYRESSLIVPLIKCVLEVGRKSETYSAYTPINLKWNYFDEIVTILFPMMEYEQNIERRIAYSECLLIILQAANLGIVRWTVKILDIIDDYSKTDVTELNSMVALTMFIRIGWSLINRHWKRINLIAGKVIFNSSNQDSIQKAEMSIELLKQALSDNTLLVDAEYIKRRK